MYQRCVVRRRRLTPLNRSVARPYHAFRRTIGIDDPMRPHVHVVFTNIAAEDAGGIRADMARNDLAVSISVFNGPRLRGPFYDPAHEEEGGAFDRAGIFVAFSAER